MDKTCSTTIVKLWSKHYYDERSPCNLSIKISTVLTSIKLIKSTINHTTILHLVGVWPTFYGRLDDLAKKHSVSKVSVHTASIQGDYFKCAH